MLALIEQRFGYPTEAELRDVIFFYPWPEGVNNLSSFDLPNMLIHQLSNSQQQLYMSRANLFDKLMNAYQNSHKANEFVKTMNLRNDQFQIIDGLRVQRMMKANDFITNKAGIVPVALQFIVKLLRYSPIMRPNVDQALRDKFFTEPLEIFKSPAQKILIPVEDVVPNENLPTFDGDIIQDLGKFISSLVEKKFESCEFRKCAGPTIST